MTRRSIHSPQRKRSQPKTEIKGRHELYQLAFASRVGAHWTKKDLEELASEGRLRNEAVGITSVILQRDFYLIQVLEGSEHEVESLFDRILRDRRHRVLSVLWRKPIERRMFDCPMDVVESNGETGTMLEQQFRSILKLQDVHTVSCFPAAEPVTSLLWRRD
jgi:Sensors of blue-light using FAD